MSAIAQQESLVKESLFQFVTKNIPSADLNVIDDIVLSYVISILEEASQDPCFDVEGFIEMMSAYFPEFSVIETAVVCSWIFELEAELSNRPRNRSEISDDEDKISLTLQNLREMLPSIKDHRTNSESSDASSGQSSASSDPEMMKAQELLQDMFPNTCALEIKHCVSIARGDVDLATATLLHRRESGQALTSRANMAPNYKTPAIDDNQLKNRIIERYSYVDKDSECKEHRPLAPKDEPKKLVRYRDNKIVSLKGERYTEVSKNGVEENLKKPKRPHCP